MISIRQIAALTIIMTMVLVAFPTTSEAEEGQTGEVQRFHMNLKEDGDFTPETQPDEEKTITSKPPKSHNNNGTDTAHFSC